MTTGEIYALQEELIANSMSIRKYLRWIAEADEPSDTTAEYQNLIEQLENRNNEIRSTLASINEKR
jgi:hypothetical protein